METYREVLNNMYPRICKPCDDRRFFASCLSKGIISQLKEGTEYAILLDEKPSTHAIAFLIDMSYNLQVKYIAFTESSVELNRILDEYKDVSGVNPHTIVMKNIRSMVNEAPFSVPASDLKIMLAKSYCKSHNLTLIDTTSVFDENDDAQVLSVVSDICPEEMQQLDNYLTNKPFDDVVVYDFKNMDTCYPREKIANTFLIIDSDDDDYDQSIDKIQEVLRDDDGTYVNMYQILYLYLDDYETRGLRNRFNFYNPIDCPVRGFNEFTTSDTKISEALRGHIYLCGSINKKMAAYLSEILNHQEVSIIDPLCLIKRGTRLNYEKISIDEFNERLTEEEDYSFANIIQES